MIPIVTVGQRDPELGARLSDELDAYNIPRAGVGDQLGLSVRATDATGELIGGLQGWTWAEAAGWEMVWVRDDRRRTGLGRRLLDAAEAEAVGRGCVRAFVSSFTFQAPEFYARNGYAEFSRSRGLPVDGQADVHFVKRLPTRFGRSAAAEIDQSGWEDGALMWEAKAVDGRADELLAFALAHADPSAQVYRSADARIVVIDPTGAGLPDAPVELIARPPHAWPFERIAR